MVVVTPGHGMFIFLPVFSFAAALCCCFVLFRFVSFRFALYFVFILSRFVASCNV